MIGWVIKKMLFLEEDNRALTEVEKGWLALSQMGALSFVLITSVMILAFNLYAEGVIQMTVILYVWAHIHTIYVKAKKTN